MMTFDLLRLNQLALDGLITVRKHPTESLWIYNYTGECQFGKRWDDYTLHCRGLILDSSGNVVARGFSKFFNDTEQPELVNAIRQENSLIEVTEKLDGSLGIIYFIDGIPHVATRGSFESRQALEATKIVQERYMAGLMELYAKYPGITPLVEIIYPSNRIVVNYGDMTDVVLLATVDLWGNTVSSNLFNSFLNMQLVQVYYRGAFSDFEPPPEQENKEGYVVRGVLTNVRYKHKYDRYKLLHKLVTGVNENYVHEALSSGMSLLALCSSLPDELYEFVDRVGNRMLSEYTDVVMRSTGVVSEVRLMSTRKEQAIYIMTHAKDISGVIFAELDGNFAASSKLAWKHVTINGSESHFKGLGVIEDKVPPGVQFIGTDPPTDQDRAYASSLV